MATTELNPFLEYVQNRTSVGAIMGIFLWREMKRAERYAKPLIPLPSAAISLSIPAMYRRSLGEDGS